MTKETKGCKHDKQETLTLRFEREIYRRQDDGNLKAEPDFTSHDVEIASKCLQCGTIVHRISDESIKKTVETAVSGFFK